MIKCVVFFTAHLFFERIFCKRICNLLYLLKIKFVYMARLQKYGIKFPINVVSEDKTLFDLDNTWEESIKSKIMHLIFTPKGQRLRNPDFGTRLIQYIFDPSDSQSWGDIVSEIKETVNAWIPECNIQEVEIKEIDNGLGLAARIRYTLQQSDGTKGTYEIITKL